MTSNQNSDSKFWDKAADKYSKAPIGDEAAYQEKLRLTREHFSKDTKVLELGCGTGSTAILHAPFVKHIEAIDISANMLEIAKQKATKEQINNISFNQSTIEDYTAADESFDVIMSMSILHLLENKEATFEKVYKMLKPGGVFISSTACISDKIPSFVFKLIASICQLLRLMPTVKTFSSQQLKKNITDAAFEIEYEWKPNKSMVTFFIARKQK